MKYILIILFTSILSIEAKIKVACIGDSITHGAFIINRGGNSYPTQLGKMLGAEYEVKNFGLSGRTMLYKGDRPYMKEKSYHSSLDFLPDVVIIKLGTNDSKPHNWIHGEDFVNDTKNLINSYKVLPSKPRIILCKPVPVFKTNWSINEETVRNKIGIMLEKVAITEEVELLDLHIPMRGFERYFPDGIHPNKDGAKIMAQHINRYLNMPRGNSQIIEGGKIRGFYGYKMAVFNDLDMGISYKIVSPKQVTKGKPWVWRARFWGHQPQLDIQLLELGYHLVYCDVAELFGSPLAVKRWDACYEKMQALGLHDKALLEGMSRGGLIIHNWAVANPDKVAGIICDNGVMDFKSWPAGAKANMGKGIGASEIWERCKKAYGFKSDDEARAYQKNPIDTLDQITQAKIPLMYLIAGKDMIVPANENSGLAELRLADYEYLNVIHKPKAKHHPHSLQNPSQVTEFALKCYGFAEKLGQVPQAK